MDKPRDRLQVLAHLGASPFHTRLGAVQYTNRAAFKAITPPLDLYNIWGDETLEFDTEEASTEAAEDLESDEFLMDPPTEDVFDEDVADIEFDTKN